MGVFFHNRYDLYSFIKADVSRAAQNLAQVIAIASGKNVEQDMKDACVSIGEKSNYEQAAKAVDFVWQMLSQELQAGGT